MLKTIIPNVFPAVFHRVLKTLLSLFIEGSFYTLKTRLVADLLPIDLIGCGMLIFKWFYFIFTLFT